MGRTGSSLTNASPIRVLVVDNTRLGCQLLGDVLRRCHRLAVVEATTTAGALEAAAIESPDVVLISALLDSQPNGGMKAALTLSASDPRPKVVILLDAPRQDAVVEAFRAGAAGVFCRDEPIKSLCKCVCDVHNGQIWANTSQIKFLLQALASSPPLKIIDKGGKAILSEREMQIVRCVAEGLTNHEIAKVLRLSEHTVKNYLFRIFNKLGVSTRVEVVLYALSQHASGRPSGPALKRTPQSNQNASERRQSLALSAEEGQPLSQYMLGQMYSESELIPEDKVSAYKWFLLAETIAKEIRNGSKKALEGLASRMSPDQVSEAERLASAWHSQHHYLEQLSSRGPSEKGNAHRPLHSPTVQSIESILPPKKNSPRV